MRQTTEVGDVNSLKSDRGPDSTAEDSTVDESTVDDSTVDDSTAELYLPTTLRRSFSQKADSTVELEKMRSQRWRFSKNTYPTACGS